MGDTADVVVVGAGLSGLECASAVVAAGVHDVLVVDAAGAATATPPAWGSTAPPHYVGVGRTPEVGGRSLHWHGVVLRLEEWALSDPAWPESARSALRGDAAGAAGLYEQVERELGDWAGGSLIRERADGFGVLASGRPVPQAVRPDGNGGRRAYTPLDRCLSWVAPGERAGRPRVRAGCQVLSVVARAGRVSGIVVRDMGTGDTATITTQTVVLAAGALDNTRLVAQLSGTDRPPTFSGLNDHLVQGFVVRLPAAALGWPRPVDAFEYVPDDGSRFSVFARTRLLPESPDEVLLDVWAMGEQVRSEGNVVSFPDTERVPWRAMVTPALTESDREVLVAQRRELTELWARLGGRTGTRLRFPDFMGAPLAFDRALTRLRGEPRGAPVGYCWPLGTVEHESGTLPLGGADVGETGELAAAAGGYVVGPATFPRSGAANPSLTTLALARWTAVRLLAG
ncbi:GMC family oxidoreductase [Mycobacterium sp.]|uniref:GMC family oxidoreductase n=1 Tax=Mycobacterium sp. TaxID=1785 RepID=UPI0025F23183|nr:GMC family oxidoreductase [Mycobacterium sp.]